MILLPLFEAMVAEAKGNIGDLALPDLPKGRLLVLGAGKAAAAMAQLIERQYGDRAGGFVVVPYGHALPTERLAVIEASHPAPDGESLLAGERMLAAAKALTADDALLMLMSGGASSLVVVPRAGVSLATKMAAAHELLGSGLPIHLVNGVRKRLSAIKGGRLALAAAPAPVFTRIISDVPGDNPGEVGSAPTVPDSISTVEILDRIAARGVRLSDGLQQLLCDGETSVTVRGDGRGGRNSEYLLALGIALKGVRFSALAADTDGIDGKGTNAGAWLDDGLMGMAAERGLDLEAALGRNNALAIFEALQSVIVTGPTRTNVNDFRAVLLA